MKEPAPRLHRDRPDLSDLRQNEDACVNRGPHQTGHGGPSLVGPRFRNQRDGIRPHSTDAQPHKETQDEHLLLRLHPSAEAREEGIKQNADTHGASTTDAVTERAEENAANRRAEHQRRREAGKPVAAECRGVVCPEKRFGNGERRERHEPQLETIEQKAPEGRREHGETASP